MCPQEIQRVLNRKLILCPTVLSQKGQMMFLSRLEKLCLVIAVLLGSAGMSFALPVCDGSPLVGSRLDVAAWDGCEGTFTFGPPSKWAGDKYVGERLICPASERLPGSRSGRRFWDGVR
jgi:hypothetical protein